MAIQTVWLSTSKPAFSDVVVRGDVPAEIQRSVELWVGCVAGALQDWQFVAKLAMAGFDDIDIEPTRVYQIEDARQFLAGQGIDVDAIAPVVAGKFMGAFILATKPAVLLRAWLLLVKKTAMANTVTAPAPADARLGFFERYLSSASFCPASRPHCAAWSSARVGRSTCRSPSSSG